MEGDITPLTAKKVDIPSKKKKNKSKKSGLSKPNKPNTAEPTTLHSEIPDPVKGNPKIPKEKLAKYDRGEKATRFLRNAKKRKRNEEQVIKAREAAARAELLLNESAGFVEKIEEGEEEQDRDDYDADDGPGHLTQEEIRQSVDITSATKIFDLNLEKFGPYRHRFTRNGRFLVLGGNNGHLAAFDWQTKRLECELSVNETVHDVTFLHNETMFAAAQKAYTCIYDNKGVELHCLRRIDHAVRLEFLPYHFLLAAGNSKGYLNYLDVSVGKLVGGVSTGAGNLTAMTQNPKTGVVFVGSPQGTVSLWSPASSKYLASILTNRCGVKSVSVTSCGNYFAAGSVDRVVSIWDARMMKELRQFRLATTPAQLTFSQRSKLAVGIGSVCNVFSESVIQTGADVKIEPYMTHRASANVSGMQFCPYEDVLGLSHGKGYSSIIIPGSGEPNFDALESNPFQSKKMRQEAEVKALLEKVPPEMITLNTDRVLDVDVDEMKRKLAERKKVNYVKIPELDFTPRRKKKGRSSAGNKLRRTQMVKANHKRLLVKGDNLTQKMEEERKQKKKMKKEKKEAANEAEKAEKLNEEKKNKKKKISNSSYALQRFAASKND